VTRLRVAVNLLWLAPGVVGGSEESTVSFIRALLAHEPDTLDLRLLVVRQFAATYPDLCAEVPTAVLPVGGGSRPSRVAAEHSWLLRRSRGSDLVHHAGGTVPFWRSAPAVLTIHDLQPLERIETHGGVKRAYLRAMVPRSVRAARLTITPSEFVRRSVISRAGAAPERVTAIHHTPGVAVPGTPRADLAARYDLDGPVVLLPAITYPHKNHRVLVEAFATVLDHHPEAVLVLTGGAGPAEAEVTAAIDRAGIGARVRRPGRVPAADLAGLYETATVLAWPSTYEGFGMPVAEAMQRGVPVVAARTTAVPEVVGDAGVLVAPDDPAAWSAAIGDLLDRPERRAQLARAGADRARRWSPERVAARYVEAYGRAAAGGG
jgi:glycosyltransferase involved in cell wall biosynthesis